MVCQIVLVSDLETEPNPFLLFYFSNESDLAEFFRLCEYVTCCVLLAYSLNSISFL